MIIDTIIKKLHVGTKQNFNYLDIATNNELVSKNGYRKICL